MQGGVAEDPATKIRREWAESLDEAMKDWRNPDAPSNREPMTVKRLQAELENLGLTVSATAIYAWLDGQYSPRPVHQRALAQVFGMKVRHLFPIEAQ